MAEQLNRQQILLGKWLDNTLLENEMQELEKLKQQDELFAKQVNRARVFKTRAEQYAETSVPKWNKASTFKGLKRSKKAWFEFTLPTVSLVMSCAALYMVVTGLQIDVHDSGITIGFAQKLEQQQLANLVDKRLAEFETRQNQMLVNHSIALQQQQTQRNTELTKYLLDANRFERREDFAELIKHVNQQRADDQIFYARQLSDIQRQVNPLQTNYSQ